MKVSIIIPVYNVAPYIEKCLQSVIAQTYMGKMECLLIDDCGQDDSLSIAKKVIADYRSTNVTNPIDFRILHHEHNRGLSAARNTGIENARGEWLYFLDSDDWIIPECIELMMARVAQYPKTEAVFAGANVLNGEYLWANYLNKDFPQYTEDRAWISVSMLKRIVFGMTAWNRLLKTSFVKSHCLEFVEGLIYEDEVWNFQLAQFLKKVSFVKVNTYCYLQRTSGIIGTSNDADRLVRRIRLWNVMIEKISGYGRGNQIKTLSGWILENTINTYKFFNTEVFVLFLKLAIKERSRFSLLLMMQALLALFKHSKYNNKFIRRFSQSLHPI